MARAAKPDAGFQYPGCVAEYVDSFVEKNVFGAFLHFFSREFCGEIAFVGLQAVIPKLSVLPRCGFLARIPP